MKIVVRESKGRNFRFMVPTGLMLNRATALILPGVLEKQGVLITREQTVRLIQSIRACRRRCPGWKLVEVESKDGDYIEISL